ncbi:DUF1990 family protein [Paractinoplanes atraurantiacus]|uniref:Uncharacterized protein, UPF0548 family n=1 Tax=Paractinoplanes atraurantiacus TaxID=1036182 RepID=A0A285J0U9_9ACTN|nr:DUF1990 domain-containing protein [Actinoplanes atraurantiacus]SNY53828.1 Uncharacterized protein, UPF0548 family [Actinoplanes atraurantiacus]
MELTYPEVGATRDETLPGGYGHVFRDVRIGGGRPAFEAAAEGLFTWQMHRGAGLTVVGHPAPAATGVDVTLRLAWLTIPCRVVYTIEEQNRRGFAYGTLPGHPERGEEAFVVELTGAGDVVFHIRAFSRPASLLARAGGPLTRVVQEFATDRYVRALSRVCRAS